VVAEWGFYGRKVELERLRSIFGRKRWFFVRITGRRRIGKTTLVQKALEQTGRRNTLYVQVPDSAPGGVLSAVNDALETFGVPGTEVRRPASLPDLARCIDGLVRKGYIVVLDEFQYFSRKVLFEFTSHLQSVVDRLIAEASRVHGGLIVCGSIHTDLVALLEGRTAPLYNRTTDNQELDHLDAASVLSILRSHADADPDRFLFFWNLFEGVPKFYRDCFEQDVLGKPRLEVLRRIFFQSSSPLRTEAENWFLHELRGRYDVVLKFVARNPGCTHGDIKGHVLSVSPESGEQVGGYMKILIDRYRMIEKKLPVFSRPTARRNRYYIRDNFLRSWLGALSNPISAVNFRPVETLVGQADSRLETIEGHGLERLAGQLYEERSQKGVGDFPLTKRIKGYWDRKDTEIDLVAVNEDERMIRLATCKRSPARLLSDTGNFKGHAERFLAAFPRFREWDVTHAAIAPRLDREHRAQLERRDMIPQDLTDLFKGL